MSVILFYIVLICPSINDALFSSKPLKANVAPWHCLKVWHNVIGWILSNIVTMEFYIPSMRHSKPWPNSGHVASNLFRRMLSPEQVHRSSLCHKSISPRDTVRVAWVGYSGVAKKVKTIFLCWLDMQSLYRQHDLTHSIPAYYNNTTLSSII